MQKNISFNDVSSEDLDAAHESIIKLCNSEGIQKLVSLVIDEIKGNRFTNDGGFDIMNIAKKVTLKVTPELENEIMSDDINIAKLNNMLINNHINDIQTINQSMTTEETNEEKSTHIEFSTNNEKNDGELINIQI